MSDADRARLGRFILVPAVITLAVTLLRLTGELLNWSPTLFNPAAGGGGALVGIAWLVPVFGIYFAIRLARAGDGPGPLGRAFGLVVLALALLPASGFAAAALGVNPEGLGMLVVFVAASVAAVPIAMRAWPALGRTLLVYGFAARVPVAVVMLFAILGNWGTHYDALPPDFPPMGAFVRWVWIGLLPQMTIWIAYTAAVGGLFGLVAGALASRKRGAAVSPITPGGLPTTPS